MEKIKAIVKKVNQEPAAMEIDNTLDSYQNLVGGYIEMIPFPNVKNVCIILNEEGKLDGLEPTLLVPEYKDVLAGNFAVVGTKDGDTVSLSDQQIERCNKYLQKYHVSNTDMLTAYDALQFTLAHEKTEAEAE